VTANFGSGATPPIGGVTIINNDELLLMTTLAVLDVLSTVGGRYWWVVELLMFVATNGDDEDDDDDAVLPLVTALPLLNFDIIALIFTLDRLPLLLLSLPRLTTASLLLWVSLLHLPSGFMGGYVVWNVLSLLIVPPPSRSSPRPCAVCIFSAIVPPSSYRDY
jgi:hypothetical protein